MNGSPTRFIEFNPTDPNQFTIYRFALASEVPPKYDPSNPVNLGFYSVTTSRGIVFNPQSPVTGGDPATLSFTVHTNELVDSDTEADPANLVGLQVNILTMTRPSNLASGARIIDWFGDSSHGITNFLSIDLQTSGNYNNSTNNEPTGDTWDTSGQGRQDPVVDIVNYSITVTRAGP